MLYIIKWVMLALCSAMGMALIPTMPSTGFILAFGCFIVLALDIARQFI
jgi:hypothetical protein